MYYREEKEEKEEEEEEEELTLTGEFNTRWGKTLHTDVS